MGVVLGGRNGGDVPLVVGNRDVLLPNGSPVPNDVVPTQWLQNGCPGGTTPGTCPPPGFAPRPRQSHGTSGVTRPYLTFGLVKRLIRDRLTFGFYTIVPIENFTTANAFYADEREALFSNSLHPELYGDRLTAVSVALGLGLKILPSLSIGAGVSLGLANAAKSGTYVQDSTNYNTLLLNNGVTTTAALAPTFGIRFKPTSWLRFGAAVHAPEGFTINTQFSATLPNGTTSGTTIPNVFDWMPWSFDFGAEADVYHRGKTSLSVAASGKYAAWSAYQDRQGQTPTSYANGLAWSNTVSGAVGIRYRIGQARSFIDLQYVPTPVPEQISNTNYVDNNRVGISTGGDLELKLGSFRFRPGVQLFVDRFINRQNTKDDSLITDQLPAGSYVQSTHQPIPATGLVTNNPGWPGFASLGWLWGGALTVSVPL
jgi:hypothetical protein